MTPASAVPSPSTPRSGLPLAIALLAVVLLALGVGASSASASPASVVEGSAADAPAGDAPSSGLDIVSGSAVFNRTSGKLKATVQMANKPPGDVDIQYGITQPGGACAPEVTLRTTVAMNKAGLYGSAGNLRKGASLSYKDVGVITATVTDDGIGAKGKINCFAVRAYGAGKNHELRDTLGPVPLAVRTAPPPACDPDVDVCDGSVPDCDPDFDVCPTPGCDPTMTECSSPDCDPTTTECPSPDCDPTTTECSDTGCDPTVTECPDTECDPTVTECPDTGGSTDGQQLSVRFYGIPKKLRRGRSYDIRIRIRNESDEDARKLKVRLTKKTGVAMSRRVASVSNVRSGKGVTVHIRVRLTSRQAKRTVRVAVTNDAGVNEQRSFVLKRR